MKKITKIDTFQANKYYRMFITWTNQKIRRTFVHRNMFDFKHIKPFDKSYMDNPGPMVVFATPGMLHAGLSLAIFKKWASNANNMVSPLMFRFFFHYWFRKEGKRWYIFSFFSWKWTCYLPSFHLSKNKGKAILINLVSMNIVVYIKKGIFSIWKIQWNTVNNLIFDREYLSRSYRDKHCKIPLYYC